MIFALQFNPPHLQFSTSDRIFRETEPVKPLINDSLEQITAKDMQIHCSITLPLQHFKFNTTLQRKYHSKINLNYRSISIKRCNSRVSLFIFRGAVATTIRQTEFSTFNTRWRSLSLALYLFCCPKSSFPTLFPFSG